MAAIRHLILFIALLQLQLFSVYSSPESFITSCQFGRHGVGFLTLSCSPDKSKDMLGQFVSSDFVRCNSDTKSVEIKTVERVNLDGCNFAELPNQLFSRFSRLAYLLISHAGLTTFRADDLPNEARSTLKYLSLSNNNIETLDPAVLLNMNNLESLQLSKSNIKQLAQFPILPKLNVISLEGNKIEQISNEIFTNLGSLKKLSLARNQLKSAAVHFPEQNGLLHIDLSDNPIEVLRDTDLVNLKHLKKLKITHGRIKTIEAGAFEGLNQLTELLLDQNLLTSAALHFDTLNKLRVLDLSDNRFAELRSGDLANLQALEELIMNTGRLTTIESEALSQLSLLKRLTIRGHQLSQIPQDTFKGLTKLNTINLQYNRLTSAALNLDDGNKLQHLDLSGNWFTELRVGDFRHLKQLRDLKIEHSFLAKFELGTFSPLRKLEKLQLTSNRLTKIDFEQFAPAMKTLTSLRLHGNILTELHDNFDQLFPRLQELAISSNKFNCSYLKQFLHTLRRNSYVVEVNINEDYYPNIRGISCILEPAPQLTLSSGQVEEAAIVKHGFESGFNVSVFVLLLWISVTNLVICGGIVLFVKKTSA